MLKRKFTVKKYSHTQQQATEREYLKVPSYSFSLLLSQVVLNKIQCINRHFIRHNRMLIPGGNFICWFHTCADRKKEIYNKYPVFLRQIMYSFDLLWHRVCPKLPGIGRIYFAITKGKNRVFPRTEILGRLYYCGFEVINEFHVGDMHYVVSKKIKEPSSNQHPSYGPLTRLMRVGEYGKRFYVYKFRTMHAYSEYLQGYVYQQNNLAEGGKFADDYRIPRWGKFMRKFWLDELPMIINLLKGDIKLIGVRPLSEHYFNLYNPELQELRTHTKPGLLPPYYVDMPNTLEEIQASEARYLESYYKNPGKTDWKYFWSIVFNIFLRGKHSK